MTTINSLKEPLVTHFIESKAIYISTYETVLKCFCRVTITYPSPVRIEHSDQDSFIIAATTGKAEELGFIYNSEISRKDLDKLLERTYNKFVLSPTIKRVQVNTVRYIESAIAFDSDFFHELKVLLLGLPEKRYMSGYEMYLDVVAPELPF